MAQTKQDLEQNVTTILGFFKEVLLAFRTPENSDKIDKEIAQAEELGPQEFVSSFGGGDIPPILNVRAYRRDGRMCVEISIDPNSQEFKDYFIDAINK